MVPTISLMNVVTYDQASLPTSTASTIIQDPKDTTRSDTTCSISFNI